MLLNYIMDSDSNKQQFDLDITMMNYILDYKSL